ncbi:MAG: DUF308 domain-containing protein [Clostridiales bacterium]|nr:DUF308 domain-containing protein [Clostridiales bacterium]
MTNIRRLGSILWALVTLLIAPLMIIFPELGYAIILCVLAFSLTFKGLGTIIYYFRMARHMVGGKSILYQGVILFDLGMVTLSLSDVPKFYVLVYLAVLHGFSGVVDILRANESKKLGGKHWRLKLTQGIINVLAAALCIFFINSYEAAVIIYTAGLVINAFIRIGNALRKRTTIYIQ